MMPPLLTALAVMAGTLVLAALAAYCLRRCWRKDREAADIVVRGLPGWTGLGLLLGATLWAGHAALLIFFGLLSFLALREFVTLAPTRPGDHVALAASFYLILPAQYVLLGFGWFDVLPLFIPLYAFLILPILAALSGDIRNLQSRAAETHWGLMLAVYCLSHVPALALLPLPGKQGGGELLMIFLLVVVYVGDMLQLVGKELFGRHAIAPRFSDARTWEGLLAELAGASVMGAILAPITPFSAAGAAGLALVIALMAALGGLVMAAIKRDHGVREWRRGGMLDRMAPLCFSAPVCFQIVRHV